MNFNLEIQRCKVILVVYASSSLDLYSSHGHWFVLMCTAL